MGSIIKNKFTLAVLLIVVIAGLWSASYIKRVSNAYLFGYPLVIMDLTRQLMEESWQDTDRPSNSFHHLQDFPDHTFKNVVRPNNDTLYSIAWLDLSDQPLILSVPDTQDRYYVIPLMDAWTNVFASVGKRTNGTDAGQYMIAGPQWNGDVNPDIELIRAPTNMVWIIGRIQTNGKADIPAVVQLQNGFTLTPHSDWKMSASNTPGTGQASQASSAFATALPTTTRPQTLEINDADSSKVDLNKHLAEMPASQFFQVLSKLMLTQPASSQDSEAIKNLSSIGITAGKVFVSDEQSFLHRWLMDKAVAITISKIRKLLNDKSRLENGWKIHRDTIGNYGDNYPVRAAVAMIGLGALPAAEAAYPNTEVDSELQELNGNNNYILHFKAGELPPVNAFWSLSMYDEDGFFIANPLNRYTIGDRDELNFNTDGSLDIVITHEQPSAAQANWLPAPKGKFALTMRLYSPKASFISGQWSVPKTERLK